LLIAQIHWSHEQEDSSLPHRLHDQENSPLLGRRPGAGGLIVT
jgi:hypothetical protein